MDGIMVLLLQKNKEAIASLFILLYYRLIQSRLE